MPCHRNITIGNETKHLSAWCRHAGLALSTVKKRLDAGMSPQAALGITPNHATYRDLKFAIGTITKTLGQWCEITGVKPNIAVQRLKHGWPVADAFFVPQHPVSNFKHGHKSRKLTPHGTKEFKAWCSMKQRCLNPDTESYPDYGGRGIRICLAWILEFEAFLKDVGPAPSPKHSINRIDNNGNYEPGNVEWEVVVEQNRNKRTNRILTIAGISMTVSAWAESVGIHPRTIYKRLKSGWDDERAVNTPLDPVKNTKRPRLATA